ncbi:MAG: hypothetical protein LBS64_00330 [Spirochaetaceae bacterium]|jgi:hypothetical protein|nr:hypothetical protein [Spirochaetaceae bacterium]
MMNKLYGAGLLLSAVILCSCSVRAEMVVGADGSIAVHAASSSRPEVNDVIAGLGTALWGGGNPFDGGRIRAGLLAAGFTAAAVSNGEGISFRVDTAGPSAQAVFDSVNRAWGTLNPASGGDPPVVFRAVGAEEGIFRLVVSPDTMPALLSLFPPESADYLALVTSLISPEFVAGGDRRTSLDNTAAIYGQSVARALGESVVDFIFTAPASITGWDAPPWVTATRTDRHTVRFAIPLMDILAGPTRKTFVLRWRA